jgi:leader peptidase (prepilin peptidase)/N-methyltransferase
MALGWHGWTALLAGTLLGWLLAAIGYLILRVAGLAGKDTPIPLGAFLIAGTFAVLVAPPIS